MIENDRQPMASFVLLRSLIGLAWLNVCLHLTALVRGAIGIVPGSSLVGLRERLDYLAGRPAGWMVAWCLWMCGAVALIAFLAVLTSRLNGQTRLAPLGLTIALVGAAFDLCCEAIYLEFASDRNREIRFYPIAD